MKAWSYSSIKAFKTCPKQFYHLKEVKDYVQDSNTDALMYGKDFHEAAEAYVRDSVALPERFKYTKHHLDTLKTIPGTIYCELEMGLTQELNPCGFGDKDAWYRGIADLVIINEETGIARIVDYKTGKSDKYADPGQLELMALCVFKHFPKITKVKAGLLFTVANSFKKAVFDSSQAHVYWRNWMPLVERLERARETGVWNANPSGLCRRHCPVDICPHHGGR
jgi:hypothetical protein